MAIVAHLTLRQRSFIRKELVQNFSACCVIYEGVYILEGLLLDLNSDHSIVMNTQVTEEEPTIEV